ncbi:MAG: CidA/LrgA family protein [Lautropia sp.]|nr:CidA/LrgA family protein [Lautropia sp.]
MLAALTLLLVFQLAGEIIVRLLGMPIPGAVVGMALLFVALVLRGGPSHDLRDFSRSLLLNMSLLLIPAAAGIMLHGERLQQEWLPILLAIAVCTPLVTAITAWLLQTLIQRRRGTTLDQGDA